MLTRTISLYKTSFSGLSSQTWLLSFIMLINRSGTMVIPFMTLYLTSRTMNRTLTEAGIVMAMFGSGAFIGAYFGGKLSDKVGFRKVQLITLACGGILFIILGQIKFFPLICFCTFILSLVNEAFRPANSSAIAFYSNSENRTRSYSLNRLAINLGWAIGSSIAGFVASYNYEILFWIDGITNLMAALLLWYFLKPGSNSKNIEHTKEILSETKSPYKDKTYLCFIFLLALFAFCFFQLFTTAPKYFRDNLHLSERYIGFVMALNGVIIVIFEMVLIHYLERKRKLLTFIASGTVICALSFLILLIPDNAKLITFLMILIITIGEIISMPFMNTYMTSRSTEFNRGQYAALMTIGWSAGQTFGPFFCAQIAEAAGFNVLFIVLSGIMLLTAFGFYKLSRK